MSKLLINDLPLIVLPALAKKIGLNEAIVLQQLHYWLLTSPIEKDGRKWVFNTYEDWQEQFPFWSISTIGRIFRSLEEKKLTVARKFKRTGYDQTKWYTINYQNDMLKNTKVESSSGPERDNLYTENKEDSVTRDILDGIAQSAAEGKATHESIAGDVRKFFGLTPDWNTKTNQGIYLFIRERYDAGQMISVFARWWFEKSWQGQQGQSPTMSQIREMWYQAFETREEDDPYKNVKVY